MYCCFNRDSYEHPNNTTQPAADEYETVNPQTQGDQHPYDIVRHQNHNYENAAAAQR